MRRQCRKCKRVLVVNSINFYENENSVTGYLTTICKRCKNSKIVDIPKIIEVKYIKDKMRNIRVKHNKDNAIYDYYFSQLVNSTKEQRLKSKHAVRYAVETGKIKSAKHCKCRICELPAFDYHHWSYEWENRLDVIPLCRSCHRKIHTRNLTPPLLQIAN